MMKLDIEFDQRPSAIAFHLRGFLPSPGLRETGEFPPIRVAWRRHRIDPGHLGEFLALTGLPAGEKVPLLYPHVFGFPLQMVILTHPSFPLPLWGALQIRNHLVQHRSIPSGAVLDMETRVSGQRILEKGAEVDLYTSVRSEGELCWESLNTFYYRGRFGPTEKASPLAKAPAIEDPTLANWDAVPGRGRRFAALTGDYNPIHYWNWYARRFGFQGAFHHPQRVLGHCLAHLPETRWPDTQRLDGWLKGPVYYDSQISLRAAPGQRDIAFAVHSGSDDRPAIIGRWSSTEACRLAATQAPIEAST
jgi:hypothetical protein